MSLMTSETPTFSSLTRPAEEPNLAQAIRRRFEKLGGVDLELPSRDDPMIRQKKVGEAMRALWDELPDDEADALRDEGKPWRWS